MPKKTEQDDALNRFKDAQEKNLNPYHYISENKPAPFDRAEGSPKAAGVFYIVTGGIFLIMGVAMALSSLIVGGIRTEYENGVPIATYFNFRRLDFSFDGVVLPLLIMGVVGGFAIFIGTRYIRRGKAKKKAYREAIRNKGKRKYTPDK